MNTTLFELFRENFLGILISCFMYFIFITSIIFSTKKRNNSVKNILLSLSNEDIEFLKDNQIEPIENKRKIWKQKGRIISIKRTKKHYYITVIFFHLLLSNHPTYNNFHTCKIKLTHEQFTTLNFTINQIVTLCVIPNKAEKLAICRLEMT